MNGALAMLLWASGTPVAEDVPQSACAREVGASATALRLAELPQEIRDDLVRRREVFGDTVADRDSPLLQTDAPTEAERGHATVRFAQAMRVGNSWFVQLEVSLMAGVVTVSYAHQTDGRFRLSPFHHFRGPACASIRAALAGVTTPGGF